MPELFLTKAEREKRKERFAEIVGWLEDWRIKNGLTRKEVAKRLRLRTDITIYYWLKGFSAPYPRTAFKIMQLIGKPMSISEFNTWSRRSND